MASYFLHSHTVAEKSMHTISAVQKLFENEAFFSLSWAV